MGDDEHLVYGWWLFLSLAAVANVSILYASTGPLDTPKRKLIWILCWGYVLMCAFRSLLPRAEGGGKRLCMTDTALNSPIIGRIVATIGEMCLVVLLVVVYWDLFGKNTSYKWLLLSFVPLIVMAEIFCWWGCMGNGMWNMAEEIVWALCSLILASLCIVALRRGSYSVYEKQALYITIVICLGFFLGVLVMDIPVYAKRGGTEAEGPMQKCRASASWEDWHEEIPWITAYFLIGVWATIGVARVGTWT